MEAVVKLSAARQMLEVRGETGVEDGRARASVELERVNCSSVVNGGGRVGRIEIRALRRWGSALVMWWPSLGVGEVDFGVRVLRAMVELWSFFKELWR